MDSKKSNTKYKNDFDRENYDRIAVNVAKGQREVIKQHAESRNESTNAFISRAIREQIKRDLEADANIPQNKD